MGLNDTPLANRVHIAFFGRRNSGKSSLVNAVTGQELSIVSDIKGTTTDPVYKTLELLPLGPVVIIDTPGIDDEGYLGELRIKKSQEVLNKTDIAVLVIDSALGKTKEDEELIKLFKEKEINYIIALNKADLLAQKSPGGDNEIYVSAKTGHNIMAFKERLASFAAAGEAKTKIVGDLLEPGDFVVLVVPIDSAAPRGRLILPQQQTIRDILDNGGSAVVVKDTEFSDTLYSLGKKPRLVITDSQAFELVAANTPPDIYLTSFSILFARYKGNLKTAVKGVKALKSLEYGDTLLISEGCTHHRQCDDIGTVKLPRWIREFTRKELNLKFTSGREFPEDLSPYKLVIHCGGCMLNEREMRHRYNSAVAQNVPITNYGILISYVKGILKSSLAVFPEILAEIEE